MGEDRPPLPTRPQRFCDLASLVNHTPMYIEQVKYLMRTKEKTEKMTKMNHELYIHKKTGYTATPVACGWAGAIFEGT